MLSLMPAIFFGHGNPMNALLDNQYTRGWAEIGATLPRPKAILCVSAHWYGPGTAVTTMTRPRTIHDFGGFPKELYEMQYPAPGDPAMAERVQALLAPVSVRLDLEWGHDHGNWSVLCRVYPHAEIPVVQLRLDARISAAAHYELAKRLASLREEGILIAGSGNLIHNLRAYAWGREGVEPFDWALRFEMRARELIAAGDHAPLIAYEMLGRDAMLSIPTPEHYLPLLYILAMQREGEAVRFPIEGIEGGSISMLSVQIG